MKIDSLLISGACLRANGFDLGEGKYYGEAKLLKLNLVTGEFSTLISKKEGGENYPDEHPNLQFTAACLENDILWLPTDTEVFKYQLPSMKLLTVFSHPCFQNIHSAHVFDDELIVTSTGLDHVVILDKNDGSLKEIINAEGKSTWHRFDAEKDYRLVHSTRPHDCHPNYIFKLDNELWVTRCKQEDAVKLNNFNERMDISGSDVISVHDGVIWSDNVVFTRVDGYLVFINQKTHEVSEVVDPFEKSKKRPIGWCRGLFIQGDMFYIGYSKLRQTKLKEKIKFLAKGNFKYSGGNNALVVAYNLKNREVEGIYETPDGLLDAIYGVIPYNYE